MAVLLGSLRATLSRTLVLMVSMGYGVVRPTLGGISVKVVSLDLLSLLRRGEGRPPNIVRPVDDLQPGAKLFLVLPVSAFDSVFVLWIFNSLSRTLTQPCCGNRRTNCVSIAFTNVLARRRAASIGWLAFETWFKSTEMIDKKWESAWMLHAFWHVLSFGLLAAICFLWRPGDGSARYASFRTRATSRKIRGGQARSRRTRRRTRTERREDAAVVQGDDEREEDASDARFLKATTTTHRAELETEMGKLE